MIPQPPPFDSADTDPFERDLWLALGERLRAEGPRPADRKRFQIYTPLLLSEKLWAALANQDWQHPTEHTYGCSWRSAGALIADLVGGGDYLDWYMCAPCADPEEADRGLCVDPEISEALAPYGWTPVTDGGWR